MANRISSSEIGVTSAKGKFKLALNLIFKDRIEKSYSKKQRQGAIISTTLQVLSDKQSSKTHQKARKNISKQLADLTNNDSEGEAGDAKIYAEIANGHSYKAHVLNSALPLSNGDKDLADEKSCKTDQAKPRFSEGQKIDNSRIMKYSCTSENNEVTEISERASMSMKSQEPLNERPKSRMSSHHDQ